MISRTSKQLEEKQLQMRLRWASAPNRQLRDPGRAPEYKEPFPTGRNLRKLARLREAYRQALRDNDVISLATAKRHLDAFFGDDPQRMLSREEQERSVRKEQPPCPMI